jgi:hypothetical protein
VSFSSFSQTDTPVVILTEDQAREVAKDLVRYDNLKLAYAQLEKRVSLLTKKEELFKKRLLAKDSIITKQEEYISIQDKIINAKKPLRFNGFVGVQTFQASLIDPLLYVQTEVELKKLTLGARVWVQPNNPGGYGFVVEYKIF